MVNFRKGFDQFPHKSIDLFYFKALNLNCRINKIFS